MKRGVVLLLMLFVMLPSLAFAECVDYAKVAIGFSMLFFFSLFFIFGVIFLMYWILRGKKYIKTFFVIVSLLFIFGMFSVVIGLIKEHGGDNIAFLHMESCD